MKSGFFHQSLTLELGHSLVVTDLPKHVRERVELAEVISE